MGTVPLSTYIGMIRTESGAGRQTQNISIAHTWTALVQGSDDRSEECLVEFHAFKLGV